MRLDRRTLLAEACALPACTGPQPAPGPAFQAMQDGPAEGQARQYLALLRPRLAEANQLLHFEYGGACDPCRVPELTLDGLPPFAARPLSPRQQERLRALLLDPRSYVFGMAKAMRFVPEAGLLLAAERPVAVLLLARSFQGSRLVLPEPLPPALSLANLDPAFPLLMQILSDPNG